MPLQPFLDGRAAAARREAALRECTFRHCRDVEDALALGVGLEECSLARSRDAWSLHVRSPAPALSLVDLESDPDCPVNRADDRDLPE